MQSPPFLCFLMRRSLSDQSVKTSSSHATLYWFILNSLVSSVPRKSMTAGDLHYSPMCSFGGTSPQGRSTGCWQSRCWMMLIGHPAPLPSPMPPTPPSPPTGLTSTVMQRAEEEPVSIPFEWIVIKSQTPADVTLALPCCDWLHQNRLSVWILNRLRFWAVREMQLNNTKQCNTDRKCSKSQFFTVVLWFTFQEKKQRNYQHHNMNKWEILH